MKSKRILLALFLLMLFHSMLLFGESIPHLEFDRMKVDMGDRFLEWPLYYVFRYHNPSGATVEIVRTKTSCGCVSQFLSGNAVGPGQKRCAMVGYSPYPGGRKEGPNQFTLTITTGVSSSDQTILSMNVHLVDDISIDPSEIYLRRNSATEEFSGECFLTCRGFERRPRIVSVKGNDEKVQIQVGDGEFVESPRFHPRDVTDWKRLSKVLLKEIQTRKDTPFPLVPNDPFIDEAYRILVRASEGRVLATTEEFWCLQFLEEELVPFWKSPSDGTAEGNSIGERRERVLEAGEIAECFRPPADMQAMKYPIRVSLRAASQAPPNFSVLFETDSDRNPLIEVPVRIESTSNAKEAPFTFEPKRLVFGIVHAGSPETAEIRVFPPSEVAGASEVFTAGSEDPRLGVTEVPSTKEVHFAVVLNTGKADQPGRFKSSITLISSSGAGAIIPVYGIIHKE